MGRTELDFYRTERRVRKRRLFGLRHGVDCERRPRAIFGSRRLTFSGFGRHTFIELGDSARMTEEEIYAQLTEIFRDAFGDAAIELRPETTAADVAGWDSVKMISIILATEERFGIKMRSREIDRLSCVGDFVALVKAKKGAA